MKRGRPWLRSILILGFSLWFLASIPIAWADGETGTFEGLGPHATVYGTLDGESVRYTAGTMNFQLGGGGLAPTFCTDLRHRVRSGDTFVTSDEVMPCAIRWLLLHYPPRLSGYTPWPDRADALSDVNQEMAARQAAVWHFSDGFQPDESTTIGERAWAIINTVPADPCGADLPVMTITPASAVNPINTTQLFTVTVTRGGEPVSGQVVVVEADLGTPTPDTLTTNDQGQATFTLTYDIPDTTSHITATAEMLLPVGTIFVGTEANKQKLVLGQQTVGPVQAYAVATWTGTGTVTTLSFDDYNMNATHDAGEPLLEGWTVRLYREVDGSWSLYATQTTDNAGTAQFTGVSAGTYRVEQSLPSGWYATTPLEAEFTLAPYDNRSFSFGQIKLPVIIGHTFQDDDADGTPDEGEPPLQGWELQLYRQDGSFVVGMQGVTGEDGTVIFSSHPDRDPPEITPGDYFVQETLQEGWYATTGISQTVTVGPSDIGHAWLGNIHPEPALALEKAGPSMAHVGDTVIYAFTVTNTGNVSLDGVTVDDPLLGGTVCALGMIQPGQAATCDAPYTIPEDAGDAIENTATATGTDPYLSTVVQAQATHTLAVLRPGLEVEASGPAQAHEGDLLTYPITLTNTGNTALDVTLPLPDGTEWTGTVQPGQTVNLGATDPVPPGADPHTAAFTATGTDSLGGQVADTATVSTDVLHPALRATLTAPIHEIYAGDPVALTFTALNIGDTPLYDVTITSDNGTPADPSDDHVVCSTPELGVGQILICSETVAPEEETTYTAVAAAHDALDGPAEDQVQITIAIIEDDDDADGDGTPDLLDHDSDEDGIPDTIEGTGDADGDGTPNYLDLDSDGDTIPDAVEGAGDADGDSTPNFLDLDSDGDSIPDSVEGADDADGDSTPNFLDTDSDGDGISDYVEWNTDADGDGDVDEMDRDADGDGTPNYLDLDSDGDGKPDAEEGAGDSDGDGIPDFLDPDDGEGTATYTCFAYLPFIAANGR